MDRLYRKLADAGLSPLKTIRGVVRRDPSEIALCLEPGEVASVGVAHNSKSSELLDDRVVASTVALDKLTGRRYVPVHGLELGLGLVPIPALDVFGWGQMAKERGRANAAVAVDV